MTQILISAEEVEVMAQLNESSTARAILEALPLEGEANVWGDEIYIGLFNRQARQSHPSPDATHHRNQQQKQQWQWKQQ